MDDDYWDEIEILGADYGPPSPMQLQAVKDRPLTAGEQGVINDYLRAQELDRQNATFKAGADAVAVSKRFDNVVAASKRSGNMVTEQRPPAGALAAIGWPTWKIALLAASTAVALGTVAFVAARGSRK